MDKAKMKRQKHRYSHDCNSCIFLGQYEEYDLYFCGKKGGKTIMEATLIARSGSDGPDYISGLIFRNSIPAIGEAFVRACDAGLLNRKDFSST